MDTLMETCETCGCVEYQHGDCNCGFDLFGDQAVAVPTNCRWAHTIYMFDCECCCRT